MGSVLMSCADRAAVPAGGALAVDRGRFSQEVEAEVESRPLIEVVREEAVDIPRSGPVVIAAGPLCSPSLSQRVLSLVGGDALSFFDAAAPIVDASTLDMDVLFTQSRYGEEGTGDYLNAPLNRDEYEAFIEALVSAERVVLKDFERKDLFQACQPAEEGCANRYRCHSIRCDEAIGLTDPRTGKDRRQFSFVPRTPITAPTTLSASKRISPSANRSGVQDDSGLENRRILPLRRYASTRLSIHPMFLIAHFAFRGHQCVLLGKLRVPRVMPRRLRPAFSRLSIHMPILPDCRASSCLVPALSVPSSPTPRTRPPRDINPCT